ncbi:MAG: hypothetical protein ACI4S2_14270 [Lachnospiraceae bacterium]
MGKTKYYKQLIKTANKKNKSEMEVYNSVSSTIDEILKSELTTDKTIILRSLIAYFDGKSSNSWFTSIMQIAYALLIGSSTILASLSSVNEDYSCVVAFLLLITAFVVLTVACKNSDFERKMVLCVLNNKLVENINEKSIESNSVIEPVESTLESKENKDLRKKKKKKKKKKMKKH